jgi:hypothetical protein
MPGRGHKNGVRAGVGQRDRLAAASEHLDAWGATGQDRAHPRVWLDRDDAIGSTGERATQQAGAGAEVDDDVGTGRQQPVQGRGGRPGSKPVIVVGDAAERHRSLSPSRHGARLTRREVCPPAFTARKRPVRL